MIRNISFALALLTSCALGAVGQDAPAQIDYDQVIIGLDQVCLVGSYIGHVDIRQHYCVCKVCRRVDDEIFSYLLLVRGSDRKKIRRLPPLATVNIIGHLDKERLSYMGYTVTVIVADSIRAEPF